MVHTRAYALFIVQSRRNVFYELYLFALTPFSNMNVHESRGVAGHVARHWVAPYYLSTHVNVEPSLFPLATREEENKCCWDGVDSTPATVPGAKGTIG